MYFTIIIPTYNRGSLLKSAIKSVQDQNYPYWECIIIDDGSTDNTKDIVTSFSKTDSRIHYIYQFNSERSAARNNGIKLAKNDWICFLDSDDLYDATHLENLEGVIREIKSPTFLFTQLLSLKGTILTKEDYTSYEDSSDFFFRHPIIPSRVCIHKSILHEFQFDKRIRIGEDTCLWTKIQMKYPVIGLPYYTAIYRIHDDNSVNINYNCYLDQLVGIKILFKDIPLKQTFSRCSINKLYSNCYYGIAKHYEYKRNFFKMLGWIVLSIFKDLKSPQNKAKLYMIYAYFR
jgi:glycosyltransferase involved in cell wall biosynthesis